MAGWRTSTATSSPSISTRQGRRRWSTPLSSALEQFAAFFGDSPWIFERNSSDSVQFFRSFLVRTKRVHSPVRRVGNAREGGAYGFRYRLCFLLVSSPFPFFCSFWFLFSASPSVFLAAGVKAGQTCAGAAGGGRR